jgi:hypothetical protein
MTAKTIVRALDSFSADFQAVIVGSSWPAESPMVTGRPELFTDATSDAEFAEARQQYLQARAEEMERLRLQWGEV